MPNKLSAGPVSRGGERSREQITIEWRAEAKVGVVNITNWRGPAAGFMFHSKKKNTKKHQVPVELLNGSWVKIKENLSGTRKIFTNKKAHAHNERYFVNKKPFQKCPYFNIILF